MKSESAVNWTVLFVAIGVLALCALAMAILSGATTFLRFSG